MRERFRDWAANRPGEIAFYVGGILFACLIIYIVCLPERAHAQGQGTGEAVSCVVTISTATTIQAVGGACAARGDNRALYITDIVFSTNAAGITADSFNTLKYGTGTACGTGTTIVWAAFSTAATQIAVVDSLKTPIRIPASADLCWINSTAGSKFLVITGYLAF